MLSLTVRTMRPGGTVCDDAFSDLTASMACKALGLPSAGARSHGQAFYGRGEGPILLDQVRS